MGRIKTARHHWWPECVSQHWKDAGGVVHWLKPSGEQKALPPDQLGAITNGHMIKLGRRKGDVTSWDENFEPKFDRADSAFPEIIRWLEGLDRLEANSRFLSQPATDEKLAALTECIISLAVRSPMNRAGAVALAERFRGRIAEPERSALIGLNMRETQRKASDAVGARAKFAIIYSPHREFIFGDGFFNNVRSPINGMFLPRILAPLTPRIAVLIAKPGAYTVEPKLTTYVASSSETARLNEAVQVYARDFVFFREDEPAVTEEYRAVDHLVYVGPNAVDDLITRIPGIPPPDPLLRAFFGTS